MAELEYVGKIVNAVCEDVSSKRIIAKFADTERVFCAKSECSANLKVGDTIELYIDGLTKNGLWAGSVDKIAPAKLWEKIEQCRKTDDDVEVTVVTDEENGLVCDLWSMMAFMPKREIEDSPMATLNEYIGQTMKARILKFSRSDGHIIISHKAAVAEEMREKREQILAQLKPEQIYTGRVKQIVDFGAFVDIGAGVEGLVHRSNLSWGNEDPANIVSIGQELKVTVLAVEKGRISLGHKQLVEDAWSVSAEKIETGAVVEGKVTTFTNFGAFVRLENGMEGLIHNSELSWDSSIHQAQQMLKLNDIVRVRILEIDTSKRKLRLSLRRVEGNPWQAVYDETPAGTKMKCAVVGIAEFGIFVDIGHGLRGLIHKNDLPKLKSGETLNDVYALGNEIECVMVEVDVARERASLSIRKLMGDPFESFVALNPVGRQFDAIIKRTAKFGAFASIVSMEDVEGLIHISELSEKRVENVESIVKTGQKVKVTVVNLDIPRRRIGLSLIAEPFEPMEEEHLDESTAINEAKATIGDIFPKGLIGM